MASISWFPLNGEPDFEAGFAGLGFEFDFTAMPVSHDAIADNQAKPGAGADGFGGVERLEQVRLDVSRDSRAVVHDFNNQLIVFPACPNANLSVTVFDGVNGVLSAARLFTRFPSADSIRRTANKLVPSKFRKKLAGLSRFYFREAVRQCRGWSVQPIRRPDS